MDFVVLFCGCGGFSEGLRQAGHRCILAVDNWEMAIKSHEANHPETEHWNKDILKIKPGELPEADIIIGSPPCQDFSKAKPPKQKQLDLSLLNHFLKLSKKHDYYIGENVPQIKPYLNGTHSQTLEALNFGLWHKRPRVFFGRFPRIPKITRNKAYFPTPRASNKNTSKQVALSINRSDKPKHARKKFEFQLSYPWYVSKWIMGFPESYIFKGTLQDKETQIGNAVCPPVARAIGEAILNGQKRFSKSENRPPAPKAKNQEVKSTRSFIEP